MSHRRRNQCENKHTWIEEVVFGQAVRSLSGEKMTKFCPKCDQPATFSSPYLCEFENEDGSQNDDPSCDKVSTRVIGNELFLCEMHFQSREPYICSYDIDLLMNLLVLSKTEGTDRVKIVALPGLANNHHNLAGAIQSYMVTVYGKKDE
jgi:hypothetical protein